MEHAQRRRHRARHDRHRRWSVHSWSHTRHRSTRTRCVRAITCGRRSEPPCRNFCGKCGSHHRHALRRSRWRNRWKDGRSAHAHRRHSLRPSVDPACRAARGRSGWLSRKARRRPRACRTPTPQHRNAACCNRWRFMAHDGARDSRSSAFAARATVHGELSRDRSESDAPVLPPPTSESHRSDHRLCGARSSRSNSVGRVPEFSRHRCQRAASKLGKPLFRRASRTQSD